MHLDTSMINKYISYLKQTKQIYLLPGSETLSDSISDVKKLISVSKTLERYNEFWDMAFALHATGLATFPIKSSQDNKAYILTTVDSLAKIIEEEFAFKVEQKLLDFLLTHPINAESMELDVEESSPQFTLFLKYVVAKSKNKSIESMLMRELLSPSKSYVLGCANECVQKLSHFQIISYAPCSLLIYTSDDLECINGIISDMKIQDYIKVLEVEAIGPSWYVSNYR